MDSITLIPYSLYSYHSHPHVTVHTGASAELVCCVTYCETGLLRARVNGKSSSHADTNWANSITPLQDIRRSAKLLNTVWALLVVLQNCKLVTEAKHLERGLAV